MTARGVAVIPMVQVRSREDLQAEVNELQAQLERLRCDAGSMPLAPGEDLAQIGGGFIAEADGWLWLVWRGYVRPLWPIDPDSARQAAGTRASMLREKLEAQAKRGWLS